MHRRKSMRGSSTTTHEPSSSCSSRSAFRRSSDEGCVTRSSVPEGSHSEVLRLRHRRPTLHSPALSKHSPFGPPPCDTDEGFDESTLYNGGVEEPERGSSVPRPVFPATRRLLAKSPRCPVPVPEGCLPRLSDFTYRHVLHTGRLSSVLRCQWDRAEVAVKVYRKADLNYASAAVVRQRIKLHSSLHVPHVVPLWAAFEDEQHIVLVMDYAAGGSIQRMAQGGHVTRMAEADISGKIIRPCLSALACMHSKRLVHGELQPDNVVLAANGAAQLCGFHVAACHACSVMPGRVTKLDRMTPEGLSCSALQYINRHVPAPFEHSAPSPQRSAAADVWALGLLVYELLAQASPFRRHDGPSTVAAVFSAEPALPEDQASLEAADFVRLALNKEPSARPSAQELLDHPWLRQSH